MQRETEINGVNTSWVIRRLTGALITGKLLIVAVERYPAWSTAARCN